MHVTLAYWKGEMDFLLSLSLSLWNSRCVLIMRRWSQNESFSWLFSWMRSWNPRIYASRSLRCLAFVTKSTQQTAPLLADRILGAGGLVFCPRIKPRSRQTGSKITAFLWCLFSLSKAQGTKQAIYFAGNWSRLWCEAGSNCRQWEDFVICLILF